MKGEGQESVDGLLNENHEVAVNSWPRSVDSFWTMNNEPIYVLEDMEIITSAMSDPHNVS